MPVNFPAHKKIDNNEEGGRQVNFKDKLTYNQIQKLKNQSNSQKKNFTGQNQHYKQNGHYNKSPGGQIQPISKNSNQKDEIGRNAYGSYDYNNYVNGQYQLEYDNPFNTGNNIEVEENYMDRDAYTDETRYNKDQFEAPEFGDTMDPHRAKLISFLNAKKLREGKIMAKINHELQIFDLTDLDCEVSIRSNVIDSYKTTRHPTHRVFFF